MEVVDRKAQDKIEALGCEGWPRATTRKVSVGEEGRGAGVANWGALHGATSFQASRIRQQVARQGSKEFTWGGTLPGQIGCGIYQWLTYRRVSVIGTTLKAVAVLYTVLGTFLVSRVSLYLLTKFV